MGHIWSHDIRLFNDYASYFEDDLSKIGINDFIELINEELLEPCLECDIISIRAAFWLQGKLNNEVNE